MDDHDRRAELVAAAVDDSLTSAERGELDALRADDPTIDAEIDELRAMVGRMSELPDWNDSAPAPALRERVIRSAGEDLAPSPTGADHAAGPDGRATPARRRAWLLPAAAVACVLIGSGGTLAVQALGSSVPGGPPGTLGAVEEVDFTGGDRGVSVHGALVAHTWGTETVLEIDGLPAGDIYSVIVVANDGTGFDAGSFLGSDVSIDCRMNAAVLREDVDGVRIEDAAGEVVAAADVPDVG